VFCEREFDLFYCCSIDALYKGLKDKNDTTVHWDCIFLPAKGAFYINYVTTSAFIGTTLELIRFPELFSYALLLSMAKYFFRFFITFGWVQEFRSFMRELFAGQKRNQAV